MSSSPLNDPSESLPLATSVRDLRVVLERAQGGCESPRQCISHGSHGPSEITPNITRIPGCLTTKWNTRAEAEEAFFHALSLGLVERVSVQVVRKILDDANPSLYHIPS
ncbi:hypothetical protein CPC08DRAFT_730960 [Agrocybe pediades]|nr:hypothetical protein CPC08DRAFT_730960 [Agrocybe pediades]